MICEGQPVKLRLEVPLQSQGGGLGPGIEKNHTKYGYHNNALQ